MQDNAQKRSVDVESAVVFNEAQFSELVHEKIHAGTRCADHLREHLLRNFGEYLLRFVFLAITRQQQQRARKPLLTGVKELIY